MNKKKIIIGARGSKLAVKYAELAIRKIKKFYNGKIELKKIATKGDKILNRRTSDIGCLLYTSPSPRDTERSRMPSSA